jgi:hypothetical protein
MGTGSSFPAGKMAIAWRRPLTSIQCWGQEWWSYTSIPPYIIIALCSIQHRDFIYILPYFWALICQHPAVKYHWFRVQVVRHWSLVPKLSSAYVSICLPYRSTDRSVGKNANCILESTDSTSSRGNDVSILRLSCLSVHPIPNLRTCSVFHLLPAYYSMVSCLCTGSLSPINFPPPSPASHSSSMTKLYEHGEYQKFSGFWDHTEL